LADEIRQTGQLPSKTYSHFVKPQRTPTLAFSGGYLTGPGLDHYVDALIDDFRGQHADPRAPVVWSVDFGKNDITWLMARAVAGKDLPLALRMFRYKLHFHQAIEPGARGWRADDATALPPPLAMPPSTKSRPWSKRRSFKLDF
jgi:hypothetical protein